MEVVGEGCETRDNLGIGLGQFGKNLGADPVAPEREITVGWIVDIPEFELMA